MARPPPRPSDREATTPASSSTPDPRPPGRSAVAWRAAGTLRSDEWPGRGSITAAGPIRAPGAPTRRGTQHELVDPARPPEERPDGCGRTWRACVRAGREGHPAHRPDPAQPPQAQHRRLLVPRLPDGQAAEDGPLRLREPGRRHGAGRHRADLVLLPSRRRPPTTCTSSSSTPSCSAWTSRGRRSATTSASRPARSGTKQLAKTREWIDRAAELDAPVIRIFAGNVPKGGDRGAGGRLGHRRDQGVAAVRRQEGGHPGTREPRRDHRDPRPDPQARQRDRRPQLRRQPRHRQLPRRRPLRRDRRAGPLCRQRPGQDRGPAQPERAEGGGRSRPPDLHPPRRPLLRLRRPRVRGRRRPARRPSPGTSRSCAS